MYDVMPDRYSLVTESLTSQLVELRRLFYVTLERSDTYLLNQPNIGCCFRRLFYVTLNGPATPGVYVSNLNGSGHAQIVTSGLNTPRDIAIDYNDDRICWTDSGMCRTRVYVIIGYMPLRHRTHCSPMFPDV